MKKNPLFRSLPAVALGGLLATLNFTGGKIAAAPAAPAPDPAAKTSFTEVTAQLDPGGNFFLYLGTAQWLEHLSTKVEKLRNTFAAMPDLTPDNATNINLAFDAVHHLILDCGVQDITGMGMSSVEIEKGLFRNKAFLHHYPGNGTGFLWKLAGPEPHALTGLDLLPANTALAIFSDFDLPLLWTVAQSEVAKSGFPQAQAFLQTLPAQFEQQTQLKWDAVLKSVGGEFGLVLTLNESNNIPIPVPGVAMVIPEPGLLLVLKVNDDIIFDRLDQLLKSNPGIISVDQANLKMRTMPAPLPFLDSLRPTTASSGGYLLISTSDALVNEALAVKSGKSPGLKGSAEFKRLSQNIPDRGNQFTYMSERFGRVLFQVQQQMMNTQLHLGAGAQTQWLQGLMRTRPEFAYAVGVNTPQGLLTVGNGSQSYANLVLLPAMIVPGMLAAIAVPNFVQAKTVSQQNSCINNLRQLDAAKNQWALENAKKPTDVPTKQDLLPYLRAWPVCPQGGVYTLGPLSETPKCSFPGHQLPQ